MVLSGANETKNQSPSFSLDNFSKIGITKFLVAPTGTVERKITQSPSFSTFPILSEALRKYLRFGFLLPSKGVPTETKYTSQLLAPLKLLAILKFLLKLSLSILSRPFS